MPASNNACLDLLPGKSAAITGLLGMFRISGGIIGISSVALALSLFQDQAVGVRSVFFVIGLLLLATTPLALMIPDTARGRWRLQAAGRAAIAPVSPPLVVHDYGTDELGPATSAQDASAARGPSPPAS